MSSLKIVYEMLRKYKQLKIIADTNYQFVIVYMKEDLFVSHIRLDEWIKLVSVKNSGQTMTKIQHR